MSAQAMRRRARSNDPPSEGQKLVDPVSDDTEQVRSIPLPRRRRLPRILFLNFICGAIMMILGWYLNEYDVIKRVVGSEKKDDSLWWLVESDDDYFSRTYVDGLRALRKLNNSNFFTGMCGRYRFDDTHMPTVSVIVTVQNEQDGMLTLTVHALLGRTPPHLLKEIIIIDDNGMGQIRGNVNETELAELRAVSPKVRILTNQHREGVARCRMRGSRSATGDVLMFTDSHVEMLSGTWFHHLLIPILENPKTIAAQTLDIISDLDWSYGPGSGDLLYGVITDEFWFGYQRSRFGGPDDKGMEREAPGRRLPYETPFKAGSLFAVRRDWFLELGGYDEGMYVWGGENTDLAIKAWCCGGRIVMVPCSRVGHMYRLHIRETGRWPPTLSTRLTEKLGCGQKAPFLVYGAPADNFTKIITRNNIRVLERWAGTSNARTGYYEKALGSKKLPPEWQFYADEMKNDWYAKQQQRKMAQNRCKNFNWFDKHVYYRLTGVHHPWHPENHGRTWV